MLKTVLKVHDVEDRCFPRRLCNWPATLHCTPANLACIVENISAGGCRLSVRSDNLKVGDSVVLDVVSQEVRFHGTISWVRIGEAGMEFSYQDDCVLPGD